VGPAGAALGFEGFEELQRQQGATWSDELSEEFERLMSPPKINWDVWEAEAMEKIQQDAEDYDGEAGGSGLVKPASLSNLQVDGPAPGAEGGAATPLDSARGSAHGQLLSGRAKRGSVLREEKARIRRTSSFNNKTGATLPMTPGSDGGSSLKSAHRKSIIGRDVRSPSVITAHARGQKWAEGARSPALIQIELPKSKMEEELQKADEEADALSNDVDGPDYRDEYDGEGEEGYGAEDGLNRPQSPVITWRPSARVKLATDLPLELLNSELLDPIQEGAAPAAPAAAASPAKGGGGKPTPAGAAAKPGVLGKEGLKKKKAKKAKSKALPKEGSGDNMWLHHREPREQRKYGAWYVPVKFWGADLAWREGKKVLPPSFKAYQAQCGILSAESDVDAHEAKVSEQILNLYSSKMYKDYVLKTGQPVPHYLTKVEAVVRSKQPTRRGSMFK